MFQNSLTSNIPSALVKVISYALVAAAIAFIAGAIVLAFRSYRRRRRQQFINEYSKPIKKLEAVNAAFRSRFETPDSCCLTYHYELNSKQQFDTFKAHDVMFTIVHDQQGEYETLLRTVNQNIAIYRIYAARCEALLSSSQPPDDLPCWFPSAKNYLELEAKSFKKVMLAPSCDLSAELSWSYSSPKGRNSYFDVQDFSTDDIQDLLYETRRRTAYEQGAAHQRSLMTRKLRWEVFQRDKNRCCVCGRTADEGAQLEVDHIIPVSKGGKTVLTNLQTLCRDCNRGKGVS